MKKILASDSVLAHFNPKARIILTVDASPYGLGAVLSQIDIDGVDRPILYASRTFNSAEKQYSQIHTEATAIVFGVRRFHQYLYEKSEPFILRSDHIPLITIFGPNKGVPEVTANRLQRYAIFLNAYNYKIEYVRSKDNCADYLSQKQTRAAGAGGTDTALRTWGGGASHSTGASATTSDSSAIEIARADRDDPSVDRSTYVHFVIEGSFPVTLEKLRDATSNDSTLGKVIEYILVGWPKNVSDLKLRP